MDVRILGILLVILATSIEAAGQVLLKKSAITTNKSAARMWAVAGVACLVIEAIVWTIVLSKLDLSIAYPMGSLCFVMVVILSSIFLKEQIGKNRWAGVLLILSGTALLGLSG